tara:strand:+ start:1305 stop:1508 length:204 start_codon:yes stop_codon:yes gene_type:complete
MIKQIVEKINHFKSEARNPRNDGWVQQHYVELLKEVERKCAAALNSIESDRTKDSSDEYGVLDEEEA